MVIVEKFFCCFELESGGLFLGWLGIITNSITLVLLLLAIFGFSVADCEQLQKAIAEAGKHITDEECSIVKTILIVVFFVVILFLIGFIVIDYLLIKGTKKRDHILIRPAVICYAIGGILYIVSALSSFTLQGFISAVFYVIFAGYIFICLYSLYEKIRDEKQGGSVLYGPPKGFA